jgi:hypothetical protein
MATTNCMAKTMIIDCTVAQEKTNSKVAKMMTFFGVIQGMIL